MITRPVPPLLSTFRDEARRRGLLGAREDVTAGAAFRLVRDMPCAPAGGREPLAAVAAWRGDNGQKHVLLARLFEALGYEVSIIVATHEFTPEGAPWLPPPLLDEVRRAPVPDVHLFLRVCTDPAGDEWTTVDATWPLAAPALGLPANEAFRPGADQRLACDPIEFFHVPEDADPAAYAARILADHLGDGAGEGAGAQAQRRERFIAALSAWLAERLGAA